jgi:hypothetical protein
MQKLIASLLLGASLLLLPTPTQASTFEQIHNASFELSQDGVPICSGTFVTPTKFLTAGHCVVDPDEHIYSIAVWDKTTVKVFPLLVNKVNHDTDTATLSLLDRSASFPSVDVAASWVPVIGQEFIVGSYPLVMDYFALAKGVFTNIVFTPPGLDGKISYSGVLEGFAPGSSGGGMYAWVAGTYRLVGTLEGGVPQYGIFFASTVQGVQAVL